MPQQHKLKACERAHHEHFAVSEMQQAQHAKDEGVADRDQGVGAAEHHPVDELLQEHWPWLTPARQRMRSLRYNEIAALDLEHRGNPGSVTVLVDAGRAHEWSLGALHARPAVTQLDPVGLHIAAVDAGALDALPHQV